MQVVSELYNLLANKQKLPAHQGASTGEQPSVTACTKAIWHRYEAPLCLM